MATVDIRDRLPPVWNQRGLNACMAIVACDLMAWAMRCPEPVTEGIEPFLPSPLFVYYNARKLAGHQNHNVPIQPSGVIKAVQEFGVCPEECWPFHTFRYHQKPPGDAYRIAKSCPQFSFADIRQDRRVLANSLDAGVPFFFCLRLFTSTCRAFDAGETSRTGVLVMPQAGEALARAHAVIGVGYDDAKGVLIVRNSSGAAWGQSGYFTTPIEHLLNPHHAFGFHTVSLANAHVAAHGLAGQATARDAPGDSPRPGQCCHTATSLP